MVLQSNEHTTWLVEHVIKEKSDIDILARYMPAPKCDVDVVNEAAVSFGERGLIRGHIPPFDGFGQPGCWQDAACMYGIENLITAALSGSGMGPFFPENFNGKEKNIYSIAQWRKVRHP